MTRRSCVLGELDNGAATEMNCVGERELDGGDSESERKKTTVGLGL